MTTIISSQRYRDEAIVAEKVEAQDYVVTLSPVIEVEGVEYQVVLDGHHSLEAAKVAGVEPDYIVATAQMSDNVALIGAGDVEGFLLAAHCGDDYYDVETGVTIW